MIVKPTTSTQVVFTIQNLKNTYSFGEYNTSSNLLKKIACQAVEDIINTSLGTGIFPKDMKQTVIYPIFKQDRKT